MDMKLLNIDKRLEKNGQDFFNSMVDKKTVCLRRLGSDRAETVRYERWIRNKKVTIPKIIEAEQSRLMGVVKGKHILGIQDTTSYNYQSKSGRKVGLGTLDGKHKGVYMHPMLILDATTEDCLGTSSVQFINRTTLPNKPKDKRKRDYEKLKIEEKESYRWIQSANESQPVFCEADSVTLIGDRENDIYQFLDRAPNEKVNILVRASYNRNLENGTKVYDALNDDLELGSMKIDLPRDIRQNRKKRRATLSIKSKEIELKLAYGCNDENASKSIKLTLVEVKEKNITKKNIDKPICWRLYTTHKANTLEEARQVVAWYKQRWNIEQIFRITKNQGFNVESSQVENVENLIKVIIMTLLASIKVMQLVSARNGDTKQKTSDLFDESERSLISLLVKKYEGKTKIQKNPFKPENLGWASWLIARMGGWNGYVSSEGLPGPIVIARGLNKFQEIYYGWSLTKDVCAE